MSFRSQALVAALLTLSVSAPHTLAGMPYAPSGDSSSYAQALAPVPLQFPGDQGPHPDFRQEWWYLTGNLDSA
ncbi:MAG: lipocalin-like domain-containing protein, partial [Steroidobacteraceae bacterium]